MQFMYFVVFSPHPSLIQMLPIKPELYSLMIKYKIALQCFHSFWAHWCSLVCLTQEWRRCSQATITAMLEPRTTAWTWWWAQPSAASWERTRTASGWWWSRGTGWFIATTAWISWARRAWMRIWWISWPDLLTPTAPSADGTPSRNPGGCRFQGEPLVFQDLW